MGNKTILSRVGPAFSGRITFIGHYQSDNKSWMNQHSALQWTSFTEISIKLMICTRDMQFFFFFKILILICINHQQQKNTTKITPANRAIFHWHMYSFQWQHPHFNSIHLNSCIWLRWISLFSGENLQKKHNYYNSILW